MSPADLALVPLDAGWTTEHGVVRLQLWPTDARLRAEPFELVFLGGSVEDREKVAENVARRLSRDLSPLPPR